ncbi:single-stranded DNA-binding protein [Pedobacter sp. UC225_65]|uniref:single-stranded DNA-binding protein n=1 Tax=Pedobacter sp. UC225_65 TaxID=3350173 RepID=UPI003671AE23
MKNVVNKVVLSGFAGSDAEVKVLAGNQKLARVNLAVNEHYRTTAGEEMKKTQWFSLLFWNANADLAELQVKRGARLTIEGRLQTGSYEAKDGSKRYTTEVVVTELTLKEAEAVN